MLMKCLLLLVAALYHHLICPFRKHSLARISKTEAFVSSLPEHHQEMLEKYKAHLGTIRLCIEKNEKIINHIIRDVNWMFMNIHPDNADDIVSVTSVQMDWIFYLNVNIYSSFYNNNILQDSTSNQSTTVANDLERVQTTLKQLVRDWSSEGAKERMMCYQPIIDDLLRTFPPNLWWVPPTKFSSTEDFIDSLFLLLFCLVILPT